MSTLDSTHYKRRWYRLKVQALIKDLRQQFGDDDAFDIISEAIRLENKLPADQTWQQD